MLSSSKNLNPNVIYWPPKCHMAEGEETENARGRPSFMKKKRKTMWTFHKSLKSKRISFSAKKCNERYSFRMDGWRDGGKRKFCVFRVVVDVIRHHQERRWVEYELRLARVNTNTRWGHPASLTSWKGQEKKYWKGGRRRLIKKWPRAEIDGDDTLVNTSHIFPSPVQK
jgi:hypothetical protein